MLAGLGLLALSAALILWARTRPGFDPYGWLNWGYQADRLSLDLGGAPSWKPLPFLFDIPYAVFGHYAMWIWMETSVAISLAGSVFAGRIAYRLTGVQEGRRWPAIAAAVFAGAAVLGIENYSHSILSAQSDAMIVAICLAAIDCHLSGRRWWAFLLGTLAGLGRPETWAILGLYTLWLWRNDRPMRRWLIAGWVLTLFLTFGIPTITNGRPLIAGDLAQGSPRKLHENKIMGTFHRFTELTYLPLQLAALGLTIVAIVRRNRTVLLLAGCAVLWFLVEEAFVLHGWPGVPRYMFEPAALMSVLAGVAVGWLLRDASRIDARVPRWAGVPVAALIAIPLVPAAISRMQTEHRDLRHERARTAMINRLAATIDHVGGAAHVRYCGDPTVDVEFVSILGFYMHMNDGDVGHRPKYAIRVGQPLVLFTPLPNGWSVKAIHVARSRQAACAGLRHAAYVYTRSRPGGTLVRG